MSLTTFLMRLVVFTVVFLATFYALKTGIRWYAAWKVHHEKLEPPFERLKSIHQRLGPAQPGDWLYEHPTLGQTFAQYKDSEPIHPDEARKTIYIQPIGEFSPEWFEIISLTAEYMGHFFCLPTRLLDPLPDSVVPPDSRRKHPYSGEQFHSSDINHSVLLPRRPPDAAAYIAFTAKDLWPGMNWNFVFGTASTSKRVGVWSVYRLGSPAQSEGHFRQALIRTLKVATHETGHIFGLGHCTGFYCNMNGSNSLDETDRQPLFLCPSCLQKITWSLRCDPLKRFAALKEFFQANGLKVQASFCAESIATMSRDE